MQSETLTELLDDARRYLGDEDSAPELRVYSVRPYVDEHYPGAGRADDPANLWRGTLAVEIEWSPKGYRALYGVYPPAVRSRVNAARAEAARKKGADRYDPLPAWELWQD